MPLFDESALPAGRELLLPVEEQKKRYTLEMVQRNQARYSAIIAALGEGHGVRSICRAFAVGQHTVEEIRDREASLVATEKERARKLAMRIARACGERLLESVEDGTLPVSLLPVSYGIATDKSIALAGEPSQVITVRHEMDQESLRRMFRELEQPVIEVETIPSESESRENCEERPQIEHSSAVAVPDVVGLVPGTTETVTLAPSGFDYAPPSTTTATTGGGGGRVSRGPSGSPMGSASENLDAKEDFVHA